MVQAAVEHYDCELFVCIFMFQMHHKLLLMYLLFDTFLKWYSIESPEKAAATNMAIFYAAMELDFYRMFLLAVIGQNLSYTL